MVKLSTGMETLLVWTFLALTVTPLVDTNYFYASFALTCGWEYGGQCRPSCLHGEYIFGSRPCAFGTYGTCCASNLPCSTYGGICRQSGCITSLETPYTYQVKCPGRGHTCCLRRARRPEVTSFTTNRPSIRPGICLPQQDIKRISPRILGGAPVNSACQWPWMVSIKLGNLQYSTGVHLCSGVLLTDSTVITTASCVQGHSVFVTVGENNVNVNGESGETSIGVKSTSKYHPYFNRVDQDTTLQANDLALLYLERPVPTGNQFCVRPVCLPKRGDTASPVKKCYIAGWGSNNRGDGLLHEANVNVLTNRFCAALVSVGINQMLPADKLCTSTFIDKADACSGDRGGMLVCEDDTGTWSLFGLISDNECSLTLPVIYTDIQSHIDWIERNLQ